LQPHEPLLVAAELLFDPTEADTDIVDGDRRSVFPSNFARQLYFLLNQSGRRRFAGLENRKCCKMLLSALTYS
jgi:hypothetical protein